MVSITLSVQRNSKPARAGAKTIEQCLSVNANLKLTRPLKGLAKASHSGKNIPMTNQIINHKTLQKLQRDLDESDVNMAKRLGVEPKLYHQLKSGEKPLNEAHQNIISTLAHQFQLEAASLSIRELFDQVGCARHKLAAELNLKPSRVRQSIENNNDPLLRKVLALSIKHPELGLIEKLSKQ